MLVCPINDNTTTIPCAFFFLPGKEYSVYKLVFLDVIKTKIAKPPNNIHMDFEAGPLKVVKAVFPMVNIVTCNFHWKQSIVRQLQKLGLKSYFSSDIQIQMFIRYLWCLTLVPREL